MSDLILSRANAATRVAAAAKLLRDSHFTVAVTGAGISMASGVPTLSASVDGVPLAFFFKQDLWRDNPMKYFSVYRTLLQDWRQARPNAAHEALAQAGVWVITQNIDGLHRDAGTDHLIELHGNLRELRCDRCELILSSTLALEASVPVCPECGDVLFPGITLEGAEVRHFSRALDWVGRAKQALIIGTKLEMEPVRRLPKVMHDNHVQAIVINENAETIVPALFEDKQHMPELV